MNELVLKISALSSGVVLLDGKPIEQDRLQEVLKDAKSKNAIVWYYGQPSPAGAPPQAAIVIDLIAKNKLPISFSSKPDFSDSLDPKGIAHPRLIRVGPDGRAYGADRLEPRMPEVDVRDDIDEVFANVRKAAAGDKGPRGLVVVRPDRRYLVLPALPATPALTVSAADMERLIPSAVKRNVAVIGDTGFAAKEAGRTAVASSIVDANRSIPFFGILMAMSHSGHPVWIFEGHSSALAAACRHADVLIVDSGMLPFLRRGWEDAASGLDHRQQREDDHQDEERRADDLEDQGPLLLHSLGGVEVLVGRAHGRSVRTRPARGALHWAPAVELARTHIRHPGYFAAFYPSVVSDGLLND